MALIWVQAVVDFTSPLTGEWASGEIDEIDDAYANPLITIGYLIPYIGPIPPSDGAHISGYYIAVNSRLAALESAPPDHEASHRPGGTDALTALTSANFAAGSVDGAAATASLRTLGNTATTAAAGNDSRIVGAAQKASNLSDLASASTARTNLLVGYEYNQIINFQNGVANQKADITFTGAFSGYIDVTLAGSWGSGNSNGKISVSIPAVLSSSAVLASANVCTQASGILPAVISLMPIKWDAANSRFAITVAHRAANGVVVGVSVCARISAGSVPTFAMSAVYATDATVPDALVPWQQPLDATLTALAALSSAAGIVAQTGADAFTKRTLAVAGGLTIANADGAAGNPTITVGAADLDFATNAVGPTLLDTATGTRYRLKVTSGVLGITAV